MTAAALVKCMRHTRSGEVHLRGEEVAAISVIRHVDRTLLRLRWRAGGEWVVFPEELEEIFQGQ